jgi:hypothetical protein
MRLCSDEIDARLVLELRPAPLRALPLTQVRFAQKALAPIAIAEHFERLVRTPSRHGDAREILFNKSGASHRRFLWS